MIQLPALAVIAIYLPAEENPVQKDLRTKLR